MSDPQQFLYKRDRILDLASFGNCWILNQSMRAYAPLASVPSLSRITDSHTVGYHEHI